MLRSIETENKPVSAADLDQFVLRRKLMLPKSYRDFLLRNNGGYPTPEAFPIANFHGGRFDTIQVFFGINDTEETTDLDKVLDDLPSSVPTGLLPIACTGSYDLICLDFRRSSIPVVFWDRVPFWGSEVWNEKDLYAVAPNFDAFIVALRDPPSFALG